MNLASLTDGAVGGGGSSVPVVLPAHNVPANAPTLEQVRSADIVPPAAANDNLAGPAIQTTADPFPPKPRDAKFQSLDVFRGLACLMLLFYHATFYAEQSWRSGDLATWTIGGLAISLVKRCWIGVPMFFVVSGYCIAASIDSLRRRPHSLWNYFQRRFRRIYPPLWLAGLGCVLFTWLVLHNPTLFDACLQLPRMSEFTVVDWISNITATQTWLSTLLGYESRLEHESRYLMHNTWTLCFEEQFYAVTGLLLIACPRKFFGSVYVVAGLTIVARHLARLFQVPIGGYFFDGHWLMFGAGILVYERLNYLRGLRLTITTWALVGGMAYGLAERLLTHSHDDKHLGEYIFVACAFACALSWIKPHDREIVAHRLVQPLLWCGKISYSIYLTHYPVTVLVACLLSLGGIYHDGHAFLITIPACLLVSLPIAWTFHVLVERRFMNAPVETTRRSIP